MMSYTNVSKMVITSGVEGHEMEHTILFTPPYTKVEMKTVGADYVSTFDKNTNNMVVVVKKHTKINE